jgi:ferredoxin-NADP reductase/uncharacterized protein YcbX
MELPYLAGILLYPVKSLDAISVSAARVLPSGALADDRRFAIVDSAGQFVNGKRNARVHLLRSAYDRATGRLKLVTAAGAHARDFHVDSERPALEEWLGEFFGFPVFFRENPAAGFPDDTDSPGPTLISTATLREVAGWFGISIDQARARFRTNLEVDGVPPFWEDRLYGSPGTTVRFSIGELVFEGVNPCQRCVVPARDAATGVDLHEFARRFVERRRARLPKWAQRSRFNHFYRLAVNTRLLTPRPAMRLNVGDPVHVIGPASASAQSTRTTTALAKPEAAVEMPNRWSGPLRITHIRNETPSVKTFRLASLDGKALPFTHLPGQFLTVELKIDGIIHQRCFTIASSPSQTDHCQITMKRNETGKVSAYLHDHAREGMELQVAGPNGRFTFTGQEADAIVLIGAGVGITPLMSVIRFLTDRKWNGEIDLIYSARTQADLLFRNELRTLCEAFPNLRVTITLTQERSSAWQGPRGRISAELLRQKVPDLQGRRAHVCGPIEMAAEMTSMLKGAGATQEQIRSESFGESRPINGPRPGTQRLGVCTGTITFTESAKSIAAAASQTILDVALAAEIPIDHGCLAGVCGRCKVRLLSGRVNMDMAEALTDAQRRDGMILACQARVIGNVIVDC